MKTVAQLLADWQSGTISPEELAGLKEALAKPAARSELRWEWQLDQAIYETLRAEVATATVSPVPARSAASRTLSPRSVSRGRLFPWLVWREARISWRLPVGLAAAACVILGGLTLYFREAAVAELATVPANAVVKHNGRTEVAVAGQALYPNDTLQLAAENTGNATVSLGADATRLDLAPGAELHFLNSWRGKRVALRAGELQATVAPQQRWRPMMVFTPQAAVKVVGTQFSLSVTGEVTRLSVFEGAVRLRKTIQDTVNSLAEVLVQAGQVAVAAPHSKLEATLLTGFLSSDTWLAPPGVPFTETPSLSVALGKGAPESGLVKVERLRGHLVAPASGQFTFWIASLRGSSPAEIWLSPNEKPSGKQRIAWEPGRRLETAPPEPQSARGQDFRAAMDLEWRRSPTQRSAPVKLVQGRRYYVEIWHRGSGIDSLALGWTLPGTPSGAPVPVDVNALCPFVPGGEVIESKDLK